MPRATRNAFHYPPLDATSLRAGCCLTSIGALTYRPGQKYPQSGHPKDFDFQWQRGRKLPDFALVLVVAGRGQWETEQGGPQTVVAGDAFFLVPGGWHRYRPAPASGWTENGSASKAPRSTALSSRDFSPTSAFICAQASDRVWNRASTASCATSPRNRA